MNFEKFDRAAAKLIRIKLEQVLAGIDFNGVKFEIAGNASYSDSKVNIRVSATNAASIRENGHRLGFYADQNKIASLTSDDGWTLVDYHPRKPKYPFIATNPQGGRYKLSVRQAQRRFGTAA